MKFLVLSIVSIVFSKAKIQVWFHISLSDSFKNTRSLILETLDFSIRELTSPYADIEFGVSGFGYRQLRNPECLIEGVEFSDKQDDERITLLKELNSAVLTRSEKVDGTRDEHEVEDALSGIPFISEHKFHQYDYKSDENIRLLIILTDSAYPHHIVGDNRNVSVGIDPYIARGALTRRSGTRFRRMSAIPSAEDQEAIKKIFGTKPYVDSAKWVFPDDDDEYESFDRPSIVIPTGEPIPERLRTEGTSGTPKPNGQGALHNSISGRLGFPDDDEYDEYEYEIFGGASDVIPTGETISRSLRTEGTSGTPKPNGQGALHNSISGGWVFPDVIPSGKDDSYQGEVDYYEVKTEDDGSCYPDSKYRDVFRIFETMLDSEIHHAVGVWHNDESQWRKLLEANGVANPVVKGFRKDDFRLDAFNKWLAELIEKYSGSDF